MRFSVLVFISAKRLATSRIEIQSDLLQMKVKIYQSGGIMSCISIILCILLLAPVHPASRAKSQWDMLILALIFYACIAEPYITCFGVSTDLSNNLIIGLMELIVDSFFLLDIYICMRTGYFKKGGDLVLSRARSFVHYLKTWFIIDFVSAVPWDIILSTEKVSNINATCYIPFQLNPFLE